MSSSTVGQAQVRQAPRGRSVLNQKTLLTQVLAGAYHTCSQPAAEQSLHERSLKLIDRIAESRRLP